MQRTIRVGGAALAVACLFGLAVRAQGRPDFSGRWTSDPDPAAAPAGRQGGAGGGQRGGGAGRAGDMGSGWGSPITIAQTATQLTVEYVFFARGDLQPPLKFVYALDGSESRNTVMMGRGMQVQRSKAAWSGDSLVITTIHTFEDPSSRTPATVEVKQTLTLDPSGTLVVETMRGGALGGPATTTRTEYRKVSQP